MTDARVGLALAGGGARGAYEIGALQVLLPYLEGRGERPTILVGTSVGALNAGFLASAAHLPAAQTVEQAAHSWRGITYGQVLRPLLSLGEASRMASFLGGFAGLRFAAPASLLDASPLRSTIRRLIDFDQIGRNTRSGRLRSVAVVTTSYETSQSLVFHTGGPTPPADPVRAVRYVSTALDDTHVRASAAIPVAFNPIWIDGPAAEAGWYCDGGLRLNTPIKPVLELGADRVVVIGLNSVAAPPSAGYAEDAGSPDVFDGAVQYLQAMLADPLANDVATLAATNRMVAAARRTNGDPGGAREVPYVFVTPETRYALGQLATDVFTAHYSGARGLRRSRDLALLGQVIDPGRGPARGELFSYLFFAPEFLEAALELGRADAVRWLSTRGAHDFWQHHPAEPLAGPPPADDQPTGQPADPPVDPPAAGAQPPAGRPTRRPGRQSPSRV